MNSDFGAVQIGSIQIFCKAAEVGSFTVAAEVLGLTPAAVSRSVARIEERLH
ncbi:MAG: helix-turn-helix domain-containing protein, partial [Giesbergeria sp.]